MRSELSRILRLTAEEVLSADPGAPGSGRQLKPLRTMPVRAFIAVGIAIGLGFLAAFPTRAQAQLPSPDTGTILGPDQNVPEQQPITPAPNPSMNNTPPELLFPQASVSALQSSSYSSGNPIPLGPTSGTGLGYRPLMPGDLVDVQIFGAPEYTVHMPVSTSGDIAIPYVGLFHIANLTTVEAAKAIARLFENQQLLHDARVIVTTEQPGYSVTILGEVRSPGIIPLRGRQRLIDVLTEAGGITNSAGHVIEVFGADSMKNPTTLLWDPTLRENDNADVRLKPGETILVSRCGVVYMGGNVGRPGAYPLCESNHMTMSMIIAEAGGVKASSWGQRTLLLRTTGTGTRLAQTVKVEDILRGKRADVILQPDDIVYIPNSILKSSAKIILSSAVAFATQALFFYSGVY
jgi:polysaccharide biosynthesis/export protein